MKLSKLFIAIFSLFCLAWTGCEKYLDINDNPNGVPDPTASALLAGVTNGSALNVFRAGNQVTNYVQYTASPSEASDFDTYGEVDASNTWSQLYNTMSDLKVMLQQTGQEGIAAYHGVADILMALNLNMALNLWGDVPYSEAFTGDSLNPAFDDQKVLYDTCIALLDRGIETLQTTDSGALNAKADFIHAGNRDSWIKTGYALKARMLNQVSKTPAYDPQAVLDALAKAYTSNEDDAQIAAFDGGNPWYNIAYSNSQLVLGGWLSAYFVSALNGDIYGVFDPRLPLITNKSKMTGKYIGTPNGAGYQGANNTDGYECYLDVGKWYSSSNSPIQIITYSECLFIKAEAEFYLGNKSKAYEAYLDGIKTNMSKMGVATSAINSYINQPEVGVGASNLTLFLIMKEKYVACFLSPVTWDDMRRMDYAYEDFQLPVHAQLPVFIRRMNYPDIETSRNGNNVPTDIKLTDHLWWDQ